ncbi:hypothetical protein B0O80DRAFT_421020 [Mortierella sp. GBAus27b]|nr:hypothetical protein B0O80DRAFT_421020 [Mortierella sp. GBAus27b]
MKSPIFPFVLTQLVVFSHAQSGLYEIRNPAGVAAEPLISLPPPWRVVTRPTCINGNQFWEFQPVQGNVYTIKHARTGRHLAFHSSTEGTRLLLVDRDTGNGFNFDWRVIREREPKPAFTIEPVAQTSACVEQSSHEELVLTQDPNRCQIWTLVYSRF